MENFLNCVYLVFERVNDFQSGYSWAPKKDMLNNQGCSGKRPLPKMAKKRYAAHPRSREQKAVASDAKEKIHRGSRTATTRELCSR